MDRLKFVFVIFALVFADESSQTCVDRFGLSSVDVLVHKQRNAKAITFLQKNINLLDDYISIDVIKSNISQLCEGTIKNFPKLETLTLINANLTLIEPGAFQNVPKLKHLSLSLNQLTRIPAKVFNTVPRLKVIYLTSNQIETIEEGAFSNMSALKAVHLDHNKIAQLTGNLFVGCPKISLIDFSYNSLKTIPTNGFADLRPGSDVRALNILLKKNEIVEIEPDVLKDLIPVNLHAESNQISRISEAVFSAKEGSALYFTGNKVVCIADDVVEWIKAKDIIVNVDKNPIDCVCLERMDDMMADGEARGQLNLESTWPCHLSFPFPGNNLV